MSLARMIAPLPAGEEKLTYDSEVNGGTHKDVVRALCESMVEMMSHRLAQLDWVAEVRMPPTIVQERLSGDGVDKVFLHCEAHIVRTDESKMRFATVAEQQEDDHRRYRSLVALLAEENEMEREDFLARARALGFETPAT